MEVACRLVVLLAVHGTPEQFCVRRGRHRRRRRGRRGGRWGRLGSPAAAAAGVQGPDGGGEGRRGDLAAVELLKDTKEIVLEFGIYFQFTKLRWKPYQCSPLLNLLQI